MIHCESCRFYAEPWHKGWEGEPPKHGICTKVPYDDDKAVAYITENYVIGTSELRVLPSFGCVLGVER